MKHPTQKTIDARGRNENNLNSESRPAKDGTNLFETHPAPLSFSDSEGDSDIPLVKRRRTAPKQSTMEGKVDHTLNHFTMEDDSLMMTGSAKLVPAHRGLTTSQSGEQHDKFCLICFCANTDIACRTCKRVHHILCLKPGLIAEQADGSFFRPLCTKRTWSEEPPSRDLEPERRLLALAAQLQNIGAMAAWIQVKDTGEALDDRNLLYEMGVTPKEVAEEASGGVASCTTPQPETSLNSPDVKQEQVKEEEVEAQRSELVARDRGA